jgi:cation diffusion facilitator family transporter
MKFNLVQRVTIWGAVVNVILSLIKIAVGAVFNSIALIADGIHSFSDLLTDIMVFIGSRVGGLPPDENHPYGHGKIESLITIMIGLFLCVIGVVITWRSIVELSAPPKGFPGVAMMLVAFLSIVGKEILFGVTKKYSIKTGSNILLANAWHHRTDSLSSVAVFLGGIAAYLGIAYADQVAGIIVGSMIFFAGIKIVVDPVGELCEHSIDKDSLKKICNIIDSETQICAWSQLRSRRVGREIFIDININVDPIMTVEVSHALVDKVEQKITKAFETPVTTVVHIEPYYGNA